MENEKRKYPIGPEHYTLYEEIGQGVSASVHRALCVPFDEVVAIKILDFERDNCDLNNISREAQTMVLVDHPNVLKSHCSFVSDHNLWVVMPYMAGGSCLHILKAAHPDGFEEVVIATVLREVLKGLEYLHQHGHIHRDVKAGNILIGARGAIKLGDFGVSACLFDSGDRQRVRNTFVGTPCWMAPEVMEQLHGYDFKADIWSFGITALELAHGHAPFSKYPPMKVLLMTLQSAPPGLDYERDRKFSKSFKQMIASCLVKDPSKRPSAKKLLKHSFFKQARSNDYIARTLLDGLPALGDRMEALKRKEEDMLAQKKMPDGQKEEISQNEYKRGISGWNFNLDDVKAQASLIQDVEESTSDNNQEGSTNSLSALEGNDKLSQPQDFPMGQLPEIAETEDLQQNQSAPTFFLQPSSSSIARVVCERSDDDLSITSPNHEYVFDKSSSPCHEERTQLNEKVNIGIAGKSVESIASCSLHRRGGSFGINNLPEKSIPFSRVESEKFQYQPIVSNGNGVTASVAEDVLSELPPKVSRTSTNVDDLDEKAKVPVVQQKGRFKVTSENVESEKVAPSPILQKSHSMQVFTQYPATPASAVPSPSDPTSSGLSGHSLYQALHSILQANISQRDCILSLMKQVTSGESTAHRAIDSEGMQALTSATEKSLLEAANDREKDLVHEVMELRWRLVCIQDELHKVKTETAQNPQQ
ncbi:serine/threonine-protein kinase OSR1 isoform X3 [Rhodamnia argentea]|uniref:Serine/threonine-protein kinase OSR1 isoform X3 n=1 Tax=Rhodamnia argentea TaxID=178133 RepID=A0A8B8QIJ4_9MYRT|nr:serine/threonine-protein kinase OSR1 isoform X3 [Rhodamnia argentea]